MEVLILKSINEYEVGDCVSVADGFARNYLLPKKFAVRATDEIKKKQKEYLNVKMRKRMNEESEMKEIANSIDGQIVEIKVKTSGLGKVFGAVTSKYVADVIKEKFNIDIDKKKVVLKDKVNSLGRFECSIKFFQDVCAKLYIDVVESTEALK